MKKCTTLSLTLFLISILPVAYSQVTAPIDKKIAAQFEEILKELNKIDITKPAQVSKAAKTPAANSIFDAGLALMAADVEKTKTDIDARRKQYVVVRSSRPHPHQIDKDILPLFESMPQPVSSLPDAKKAVFVNDEQNRFLIYVEKLKRYREQLAAEARKQPGENVADLEKQAKENADRALAGIANSTLVQEAGGMEKLKQMTPAERAALGKKMTEKAKANPYAYTGHESDPRKSFSKKIMLDPNYAARFQHMNKEQQQEEYKAFMKENGFVDNEAQTHDRVVAGRKESMTTIAITSRLTEILNHRKQLAEIVSAAQTRTDKYFSDVEAKLSAEYSRRIDALPFVEHGEAGKSKETGPVDIAYSVLFYTVNARHATANVEVFKRYGEAFKITIGEYNEFVSEYWGVDKATDLIMEQRNQTPPVLLAGACGELISLTEMAHRLTSMHGGWQRSYDQKVLQLYEPLKN